MAQRIHRIRLQVTLYINRNEKLRPFFELHMLTERTDYPDPSLWWHGVGANSIKVNKHNLSAKINDLFRRLNELPEYRRDVT